MYKTPEERKALKEEKLLLEKTLKRIRFEKPKTKRKPLRSKSSMVYSRELYASLVTESRVKGIDPKEQRIKQLVSSQYEIGQAYNKSGFQVLSKKECQDPNTAKRR